MRIPAIHGYIDRRILINYTIDADIAKNVIPSPFRPKLYKGKAIGGICLIRLKNIKPKYFPNALGIASENGAHRFAVEWDEAGTVKEGVYIPRRDTSSAINYLAGGRIFPGKHHHARFNVSESNGYYNVGFTSNDNTSLSVEAKETNLYPNTSVFKTIEEASAFFRNGCIGYSPNNKGYDGVKLYTYNWEVKPLDAVHIHSSYFENEKLFPKGSVIFDNALLMHNIEHEWQNVPPKR